MSTSRTNKKARCLTSDPVLYRLIAAEVSAQQAIMALAQHQCMLPAASGDTKKISLTLSAAAQDPTKHQEYPACRCAGRMGELKGLTEPID